MKIDSIGSRPAVPQSSNIGKTRVEAPAETRQAHFKEIVRQEFDGRSIGDLRSLVPLSDDEKNFLARLFVAPSAPSPGYDAMRNHAKPDIAGNKLDIEA